MTKIYIDKEVCKGCRLCIHLCPKEVYEMSNQRNKKGYIFPEAKHPEKCILCKNCEINCPDLAIYVEED
ncbi:MAG: 4Fe-4S binding protein [Methanomicrobia archaeon]|nr:4Fe-4S binding protein [Methanomicrobia archaeon]